VDDALDWTLLRRYADRECTAAESATVEAWLVAHPEWRAEVDAIRSLNATVHALGPTADLSASWRRLSGQIGLSSLEANALADRATGLAPASHPSILRPRERTRLVGTPSRSWPQGVGARAPRRWASWVIPVAASMGLAIGVLAIGVGSATWGAASGRITPQGLQDFTTPAGGRATVTLGDGTRLILGPASRLRVPSGYGAHARTVELSGEALFAVVHDARRPFAVRTAATVVRDIGTMFAVRAYADDAREQIAVQEGSVSIGALTLRARDVATVSSTADVTVHAVRDIAPYLAWSQGQLAFSDTPLRDVVRELGRTFNLSITVVDSTLANTLVTESFTDQPIDVILDDITAVVGAQYHRTGRSVTIRPRARGATQPGRDEHPPVQTALAARASE
jgi:ferric-dicitrate binding protein FerR (iron transport regulator)